MSKYRKCVERPVGDVISFEALGKSNASIKSFDAYVRKIRCGMYKREAAIDGKQYIFNSKVAKGKKMLSCYLIHQSAIKHKVLLPSWIRDNSRHYVKDSLKKSSTSVKKQKKANKSVANNPAPVKKGIIAKIISWIKK